MDDKHVRNSLNPDFNQTGERSQFNTITKGGNSKSDTRHNDDSDEIIEPYAVVYNTETNPKQLSGSSEGARSNTGARHLRDSKNATFTNPMYGADNHEQATDGNRSDATDDVHRLRNPTDALRPNPMYGRVPMQVAVGKTTQQAEENTTTAGGKQGYQTTELSSIQASGDWSISTVTDPTGTTTAGITSNKATTTLQADSEEVTIPFDGPDSEGDYIRPYALAVSSSDEIFVTETTKKQILVYNMKGAFLRKFDTTKVPWDVSIDNAGHLWVVAEASVHKYNRNGMVLVNFDLPKTDTGFYIAIALDTLSDNIIVTEMRSEEPKLWEQIDHKGILLYQPNGTMVKRFGIREITHPNLVTVDKEGNIFVVDSRTYYVYKYDKDGNYVLKFGGPGSGNGYLDTPIGSCMFSSGRLLVADNRNDRVEMFRTSGEYIRTAAKIDTPRRVATGVRGQLVVKDGNNDIHILPKY
ncbi:TRIM2 [Branchiostoma lanceolatum]|uniref:TRIM2 protein n=1 Tax=Branchiostoma lanceolatum TaxID=7740 RepID=A0A8K0EVV4_BRALA|nr:TRIM2 [Branchiostoma lanceolatum]